MSLRTNTHEIYNTINHEHLDSLVNWARGEFPTSGLVVVEYANGKWFVEVDYGHEFDQCEGISKPEVVPFVEPVFFETEEAARGCAHECIRKVYPELAQKDLSEFDVN